MKSHVLLLLLIILHDWQYMISTRRLQPLRPVVSAFSLPASYPPRSPHLIHHRMESAQLTRVHSRFSFLNSLATTSATPAFTFEQLPEETLYVLDGTAMLFLAYHSKEHASQHYDAVLTADMSSRLVRNLSPEQRQQLIEFYNDRINVSGPVRATEERGEEPLELNCGALTTMAFNFARFVRDVRPKYLAVAFDAGQKTFRVEQYPAYKATRTQPPLDLLPLFPLVPHVMEALGCRCLMKIGYEADDLMASLGSWAQGRGLNVVYVSNDKDLLQLIDYGMHVMQPRSREMLGQEEVFSKHGVIPSQFCDYQALHGDSSDNIPGVKGIGPKTAAVLLQYFGSIENMYKTLGLVGLPTVPPHLADVSPTSKLLQQHLSNMIVENSSSEVYSAAVSELRSCLADVNAKAETVLARLYQCGYSNLLLYKNLVTLRQDLLLEQMLMDGSWNKRTSSLTDENSISTEHFRYRGENPHALHAATLDKDDASAANKETMTNSQEVFEDLLKAISPSLLPTLQLLREQYHKLDRSMY